MFFVYTARGRRALAGAKQKRTATLFVLPLPPPPSPSSPRQDQRGALIAEKRDKAAQVAEMKQGLRRLRLAGRLGVAARELAQDSIEVPNEAIGRVSYEACALLMQAQHKEVVLFLAAGDRRDRGGWGAGG